MGLKMNRRVAIYTAAALAATTTPLARAATIPYDNGGGDNTWETAANWVGDVLPGINDSASLSANSAPGINGDLTVSISSAQIAGDVAMQDLTATAPAGNIAGVTTLNVLPNAELTIGETVVPNTTGFRVGRGIQGGALGSSTARVFQTGGVVQFIQGANGVRMSASDAGNVADSLYRISDGRLRGANGTAAAIADLRVGATTVSYNRAEFHVNGSGVDELRFLDVQVADSNAVVTSSGGTLGRAIFHWTLDAGGATAIVAEDEFQFRAGTATGTAIGLLQVDLAAAPPTSDITLVTADRLGNNGGALERFSNYADLDTLVATGAGWEYTYLVDYTDASDNSVLDASIILRYQSRAEIPEPSGLALLALGGLAAIRRQRRVVG